METQYTSDSDSLWLSNILSLNSADSSSDVSLQLAQLCVLFCCSSFLPSASNSPQPNQTNCCTFFQSSQFHLPKVDSPSKHLKCSLSESSKRKILGGRFILRRSTIKQIKQKAIKLQNKTTYCEPSPN